MAIKIMLDAGHTGTKWNKGAVAGYYESKYMWTLHEYLAEELKALGFEVGKTRKTIDTEVDVVIRGKAAKGYDLFLSLHSNSTDNNTTRRVVAIYQTDDSQGVWDTESRILADKLAAAIAETMGVAWKNYSKLSSNDRDGDGKKDDNYYGVLHGARLVKVPAVILEHSFHSNPETCRWLMNDANLRKLAKAEANCLAQHYGLTIQKPVVKEEPVKEVPTFKAYTATIKPLVGLNVRTGAGTSYKKLGALAYKTKIKILEEKNGWGRIDYKGSTGWVSLQYIKKK